MRSLLRRAAAVLAALAVGAGLLGAGLHVAHSGTADIPARTGGTLRIATLNVHYILGRVETGAWSRGDWEGRKRPLQAAFAAMDADLVAFQEMETFEGGDDDTENLARDWLLAENPGYGAAAVGDWRQFPSTQPVLYRRDRLRVLDQGWFFFSDTPEVIYSRTFDGSWPAFCSWVAFERLSDGRRFHVFNVHLEYRSRSNRLKAAALVRDRMAPVIAAGGSVILLGDTNAFRGSATHRTLEEAGLAFAPVRGATYHLNAGLNLFPAIDHIALAGPVRLQGPPVVVRQRFLGRWPSNHYPVLADVVLAP